MRYITFKKAATIKMGTRLMQIFMASLAALKKDCFLVYVPGNKNPKPNISPAQLAITIAEISSVPCIHITITDCQPNPCEKKCIENNRALNRYATLNKWCRYQIIPHTLPL